MTQEDKELLLRDLCARIPYGVKVRLDTGSKTFDTDLVGLPSNNAVNIHDTENYETIEECFIWNIKPYLRLISSMTEEERKELYSLVNPIQRTDFYYSHHIDCRFMIDKGLALEAPEGMYKTE